METSYCRFENTYPDLKNCYDDMDLDDLSESEQTYRRYLIQLCKKIVEDYGTESED